MCLHHSSSALFDEELQGPALALTLGAPTDQEVWLCAAILCVAMVKSTLATVVLLGSIFN